MTNKHIICAIFFFYCNPTSVSPVQVIILDMVSYKLSGQLF